MTLARRQLLRMATWACACGLAAGRAGAAQPGHSGATASHPHWISVGDTAPEHWGELQPDFKVCQLGLEQTPIDLMSGIKGEPGTVALDYKPVPLRVVDRRCLIETN